LVLENPDFKKVQNVFKVLRIQGTKNLKKEWNMRCILKTVIILFALSLAGVFATGLSLHVNYKTDAFRLPEETVKKLVIDALATQLSMQNYSEGFISLYSKNASKEIYLTVYLLMDGVFGITGFRLDIENEHIVRVIPDYVEEEPLDPMVCGTCPDPELQVVVAYVTDFLSTTMPSVTKTKDALIKAGVKFVLLKDNEESKTSMLNYLSCPKMVMWSRIGHGSTSGAIMFGPKGLSGSLTTKDVTSAPYKDAIKKKFFPFNCCYVGGNKNTFGKGMISSGASWMCAGDDVSIATGTSEPVWANFMVDVCTKNAEVIASFDKYMKTARDKWRYQSASTGPYYPFQVNTSVDQYTIAKIKNGVFSVSIHAHQVVFNQMPGSVSIYTLEGQMVHQFYSAQNTGVWNLQTVNNRQANAGIYVAILKSSGKSIQQKLFRIVR
jgi:hypothetical protein